MDGDGPTEQVDPSTPEGSQVGDAVAEGQGAGGISVNPTNLPALIRLTRKTSRDCSGEPMLTFERRAIIARATTDCLRGMGTLYQATDGYSYFFDAARHTLVNVTEVAFKRFLAELTGLNPTETEFGFVIEHLLTEAFHRGVPTAVHRLAHYDRPTNRLYVTDFGTGMHVLNGSSITHAPNGANGVLFATAVQGQPYTHLPPSRRPAGATLQEFLDPIPFDPAARLSPADAKVLLYIWFHSIFFHTLNPTKLIPLFLGIHGSAKTSTTRRIGMQLMGEGFNVVGMESGERGEHAFIATVCGKPFAAFDNADAPLKWLPDRLATYATGQDFELRKLYTTNELAIYHPVAHIVLTSRDPYFRRPDVAERLLICRLRRLESFVPESDIWSQTLERRDAVWSDLLDLLNQALVILNSVPEVPESNFRMADFAAFGYRLSVGRGGPEAASRFLQSLELLEQEQAQYATEEDPLAAALAAWLTKERNLSREVETSELYRDLSSIAKDQGLLLPRTPSAFARKLNLSKRPLEMVLGVRITARYTTHGFRWMFSDGSANG